MKLRHLVPTLAAIAVIPTASAFEVQGDGWKIGIEPRLQSRIAIASASSADGDTDYDIWEKSNTDNPQQINFEMRRARIYFKGSSDSGWKFNYTIMADHIGREDDRDEDNIKNRYAWIGKKIKSGDISHYIQFGVDKHTACMADVDSSSKLVLPNGRLVAEWSGPRSVGLDYTLSAPMFGLKVGIADEAGDDNNDWHVYARVHTGLTEEWSLSKRKESYLGEEGFGHQLGLGVDFRMDGSDETDGTEDDDYSVFFLDYLVHWNQLTGLIDVAMASTGDAGSVGGTPADTSGLGVNAQVAYAIPLDEAVVEPVVRLTYLDNDDDNDDEAGVLNREGGASGMYIDAGLTYYLDGHNHKIHAAVQSYTPEEGDGDAFVFRLQHDLEF